MAAGLPSRSCRDAVFSQSWWKRRTSVSVGWVGSVGGQEVERAAGGDGVQLGGVADEQQFRAGLGGLLAELVEGEGAGQGRFVEDDQLPWVHATTGRVRPGLR